VIWVKIDETLPWIELKGEYQTKEAAKNATGEILDGVRIKIVKAFESGERVEASATEKQHAKSEPLFRPNARI
jgi:hypothetical protein